MSTIIRTVCTCRMTDIVRAKNNKFYQVDSDQMDNGEYRTRINRFNDARHMPLADTVYEESHTNENHMRRRHEQICKDLEPLLTNSK